MSQETITIKVDKADSYLITLPVDSVKVANRFRQELGDIGPLAASIKELGLLQPIGVDRGHNLIFGQRRLDAHKALGLENIKARMITVPSLLQAEEAENNLRKDFTTSERVAIAAAIKAELGTRQGQRTDLVQGEPVENFPQVESGQKTRQIIAKKAGFGNETTLRQAATVVEQGEPELIAAMDRGDIAISTAAKLATAQPEMQRQAAAQVPAITDDVSAEPDQTAKQRREPSSWQEQMAGRYAKQIISSINALLKIEKDLLPKDAARLAAKMKVALSRLDAVAAKEVGQ